MIKGHTFTIINKLVFRFLNLKELGYIKIIKGKKNVHFSEFDWSEEMRSI